MRFPNLEVNNNPKRDNMPFPVRLIEILVT